MSRPEFTSHEEIARTEQIAYKSAIAATHQASRLLMNYWPNPNNPLFNKELVITSIKNEGVANFATIADEESERLIKTALQGVKGLHNFSYYGEEFGHEQSNSPYTWIVNQIDGTTNFLNSSPDFGINIALTKNGQPFIGVIALPAHNLIISALKEQGIHFTRLSKREEQQIQNKNHTLSEAIVAVDLGYTNREEQLDTVLKKLVNHIGAPTSYFSASFSNFRVAAGLLHAFIAQEASIYDIAAAVPIIEELGGKATTFNGGIIDITKKKSSYVASLNPAIHKELISLLNA